MTTLETIQAAIRQWFSDCPPSGWETLLAERIAAAVEARESGAIDLLKQVAQIEWMTVNEYDSMVEAVRRFLAGKADPQPVAKSAIRHISDVHGQVAKDGHWIHFQTKGGKAASLCCENLPCGPLVRSALIAWVEENNAVADPEPVAEPEPRPFHTQTEWARPNPPKPEPPVHGDGLLHWNGKEVVYPQSLVEVELRGRVKELEGVETAAQQAIDFAHGAIRDAIYLEDGLDGSVGERVLRILDEWMANRTFDELTPEQIKSLPESTTAALNRAIGEIEKLRAALRDVLADTSVREIIETMRKHGVNPETFLPILRKSNGHEAASVAEGGLRQMIPDEQIRDWIREQEIVASHGLGVWAEAARDVLSILRELIEKRAEVERYKAAEEAAEHAEE